MAISCFAEEGLEMTAEEPENESEEPEFPKYRYRRLIVIFSALAAWLFVIAVGAAFWFLLFPAILHLIARF
jgi:hypothetical protein